MTAPGRLWPSHPSWRKASPHCSLVLAIDELIAAAGLDPSFYAEGTYDNVEMYY